MPLPRLKAVLLHGARRPRTGATRTRDEVAALRYADDTIPISDKYCQHCLVRAGHCIYRPPIIFEPNAVELKRNHYTFLANVGQP